MLIDIEKVLVKERIRKDFGNIEELSQDIKENGLINPPVVTPEFELIAGERRLRACKALGFQQIEVRVMSIKDALHQLKLEISENENRKDFSFNEKMTWAKMLEEEYKKIAKENQLSGLNNQISVCQKSDERESFRTDDKVAQEAGFGSRDTYKKAQFISENADEEMIKALDEGKLSINKAYTSLKQQKEMLENQLEQERNKPAKVIDKTDYGMIENLKSQLKFKDKDVEILKRDKDLLERKVKLNEEDAKKFKDLKQQIEFLSKEKEDISRQIQSATELSGLAVKIDNFLKTELSPIRYSRTLERMDSEVAVRNLSEIIESVENWCSEIRKFLPNNNIIDIVEVL